VEPLEARTTPSIITWTNRGVTSGPDNDYFNDVFGARAALARSVVDNAISEWTRVITNLNGAGSGNSLPMKISMNSDPTERWIGASTSTGFYGNGMPSNADMIISRGNDGHGGGWYLEPTAYLFSSAYTADPGNAFTGYARPGSPAAGLFDLEEVVAHEMGHGVGYVPSAKVKARASDTGVIDIHGVGTYWAFVGNGGFSTLTTSFDGSMVDFHGPVHAATKGDPHYPISWGGRNYWGSDELMAAICHDSQRRLVSRNDAYLLRDSYGYTVNDPASALGTFYAQLDDTGKLWVRGRTDAASTDSITVSTHSSGTTNYVDVTVAQSNPVPGTYYTGPFTASFFAAPWLMNSVEIDTGPGTTTVNIQKAYNYPITVNSGGPTVLNVGVAGSSLGVGTSITVNNPTSHTVVNVDDSADTTGRIVTLSQTTLGGSLYGTVAGLTGGTLFYKYSDTYPLNVMTGSGSNTINVLATGVTTNLFDRGVGMYNVGNAGSVADIRGALNLENEPSHDTVTIYDSSDAATHTAVLDTVPRSGESSLGRLAGLGNAPITWDYSDTSAANVYFGSGTTTVNVLGTGVPTDLWNNGPATVNVGHGGSLGDIQGALTLENGPSWSRVYVNDWADSANHPSVTLTATSLTGLGPAPINFHANSLGGLVITAGNGTNAYTVVNTQESGATGGNPTTLNTGSGTDTVIVQATGASAPLVVNCGGGAAVSLSPAAHNLNGLAGAVTVVGGGGSAQLAIHDEAYAPSTTYALGVTSSSHTLARPGAAPIAFSGLSGVAVYGGGGGDTFAFGSAASLPGALTGGAGNNTLDLGALAAGLTVSVTAANAGTVPGVVGSFASVRNVTAGGGDDTFVFANGASLSGAVSGGGGFNTLDVSAGHPRVNYTGPLAGNIPGVVGSFAAIQLVKTAAGGGTFLAASFPGGGVWRSSAVAWWGLLHTAAASAVAVDDAGDVAAMFPGYGLCRYEDAAGWQRLSPSTASRVSIAGAGTVAGELPGSGVWRYEDATGWQWLSGLDASALAVAPYGDVVAEFPGRGLWLYHDGAGWGLLTTSNASQVSVAFSGAVAAAFPGYGVWRYQDGAGWQQLTSVGATSVSVDASGDVAAALAGYGVWRYRAGVGWQLLATTAASEVRLDALGEVACEFPGYGVWRYRDGSGWQRLTPLDASALDG
jgi:hypothetical protein